MVRPDGRLMFGSGLVFSAITVALMLDLRASPTLGSSVAEGFGGSSGKAMTLSNCRLMGGWTTRIKAEHSNTGAGVAGGVQAMHGELGPAVARSCHGPFKRRDQEFGMSGPGAFRWLQVVCRGSASEVSGSLQRGGVW